MRKTTSTPDKQIIGKSDFHHPMMEVGLQSKRVWTLARFAPVLLFLFAIPAKAKAKAFTEPRWFVKLVPIVLFFVAIPNITSAFEPITITIGLIALGTALYAAAPSVVGWAVGGVVDVAARLIGWFILWLASWLLLIAQSLFNFALAQSTQFSAFLPVIEIGWKVTRDATNIFFIIILLFMAIGTILRLQNYNAKRLLVNLVLMAILINFSLAIGSVVIDFSNVLGIQFLTAIDKDFKVSEVIMKDFQLATIFNAEQAKTIKGTDQYLLTTIGGAIFILVLAFTLFVSGILMIVRWAVLIFLLVIAPIAFLFYILPETQKHWSKWWDALIQYSFFFPAYAFLLYVAIRIIQGVNAAITQDLTSKGIAINQINFVNNYNLIVGYILGIVFLLTALIMGNKMGIAGSDAVIGWAKTGRKYVTGALGSGALYPVRGITRRIATTEAVQRLKDRLQESRIPGGATLSRGIDAMLQRGAVVGQMRPKSAEQTADFLSRQSNAQIAKAFPNLSYAQKMALLRKLPKDKRDALMKLLPDNQKALALRLSRGFEGEGRAGELEAAEWQRIKSSSDPNAYENSMRHFANMSRAGKEQALRTMDQKEQADYVTKLRAARLTDAADQSEDIIKTEFTQQQRAEYDVAGFQQLSTEEQFSRIGDLSNQAASAFLLSKPPEERRTFIDRLAQTNYLQAQRIQNAMRDYFTPEDLIKQDVAEFNSIKDPARLATEWGRLSPQAQEAVIRERDARQRASLANNLFQYGQPADYGNAIDMMQNTLSRAELAKTRAALHMRQTPAERRLTFDQLEDLDVGEVINELKTPEEQWEYINNLTATQQVRARDAIRRTLPPDAFDDFRAYEVVNRTPAGTRGQEFVNLTEKQRVKALRNVRGRARADLIAEINDFNIGTTRDGWNAVVDTGRRMTQREIDQMNREICGQLQDTY